MHTTNYTDTFIEVAAECPATSGEIPPTKADGKSVAGLPYELIKKHPYQYDSDDVIFHCYAVKNDLTKAELVTAKEIFFSKGQPCLRASPLTKRYGWGVHSDANGKVAIYGVETAAYKKYATSKKLDIIKAMRAKKA